jgi:flagellum-specific ATP synthase
VGAYSPGHDAELDSAVRGQGALMALLQQDMDDAAPVPASLAQLARVAQQLET